MQPGAARFSSALHTAGRSSQTAPRGELEVVTRRFDLQTGESVIHLGGDEFQNDVTGLRLKVT
jgi:hypothetical protein